MSDPYAPIPPAVETPTYPQKLPPRLNSERFGTFNKDCLYSVVQNTSGVTMRFGFLPPHGVQLVPGEEFVVFGNILDRIKGRRSQIAFAAAIDRQDITIVSTPAPILQDTTTGASKMIRLQTGTLGTTDPCWANSDSLEETPV